MIFVVAGTSEGKEIVTFLLDKGYKVIASVTTDFAGSLFTENENLKIITQKLTAADFENLFVNNPVKLVVDMTHPFAVEASENIITAAKATNTNYIRFERENFSQDYDYENIIMTDSYEEAAEKLINIKGNVFCTTGSKDLHKITSKIDVSRVFPRVLSLSTMVKKCEDLGIPNQNIIAMKGPFSSSLNIEIMKNINAGVLVTKESGETGGIFEKLEAAKFLNIPVIMIKRKEVNYPQLVRTIEDLKNYIEVKNEN
ncbi:MAG: precorrin-6A reductase [Rhodothermaceae bacterium]